MRKLIMDDYAAWDPAGRDHAASAFPTGTLRAIEEFLLSETIENSAETGCGKSTILFSNISAHHTVFALDDRHLGSKRSSVLFYEQCPLTRLDRVSLVPGPTQKTLPAHRQHRPLDLLLVDGPHGYPFPELEYYFFYPHLRAGALLILDDVTIPTIGRLADFIAEDSMFETVALIGGTAVFRRTAAPTFDPLGDGWFTQRYNRRRVSPRRDIFLADGPVVDQFTSQQIDHRLHDGNCDPPQLSVAEQIRSLRTTVAEQRAELESLKSELSGLALAADERDRALATIAEMQSSTSWRVTAPARRLSALLKLSGSGGGS